MARAEQRKQLINQVAGLLAKKRKPKRGVSKMPAYGGKR